MSDYDPAARREYYLRTRELKGRQAAQEQEVNKKKSKAEKEKDAAANKAKGDSNWARSQVSKEISEKNQKDVAQVRALIKAKGDEITKKFQEVMAKLLSDADRKEKELTKERDAKLAKVAAEKKAKLAAVPPIPENASPQTYEKLRLKRIKMIKKIKGDAAREEGVIKAEYSNKRTKAAQESRTTQNFVRAVTKSQKEQLRTQLTSSLNDAKKRYETLKQGLGPKL